MALAEPVIETPYFLSGDGEMAARMRDFDWAATPFGPAEHWPEALKFAVSIMLQSGAPMAIYWGSELRLLYNDAWAAIPAERHPWALARPGGEVWAEIWDVVGPQMQAVLASGRGFSTYNQLLGMHRGGRQRDTWWNYSFTPIRGDDGRVLGILNEGREVTDRVQLERRQDFLLRLSDALRELTAPLSIINTAQQMLGEHLAANRVGYGEVDSSERWFTTANNWTSGVPPRFGTHDLAAFGAEVHHALRTGVPLVIEDIATDPRTSADQARLAFEAIDTSAAITASLVKKGRMVAAVYVHNRESRSWDAAEVQLVQDVAERIWAEVARARAEAEARSSEERYRRIFEQASDLIITCSLDRQITSANPAVARALGLSREQLIGRTTSDLVLPEFRGISTEMLERKLEDGANTRYEVQVQGAGGKPLNVEINSGLTFDERGAPIEIHVVGRDITERKRWEAHQQLLVGELNHRVKNTLSIVQSLSHQTFRPDTPPAEAITAFEGRLQALAAAHNLLTRENWEAASIGDIVDGALSPFCTGDRCGRDGPEVRLPPQTAVSLALALHELATNAAKYGALRPEGGQVSVRWTYGKGMLALCWRESGGPPVSAPTRRGFGTRMLERALARELGGSVVLRYEPSGVVCEIDAPVQPVA